MPPIFLAAWGVVLSCDLSLRVLYCLVSLHQSTHQREYVFGESLVRPQQTAEDMSGDDRQSDDETEAEYNVKPAAEFEVKSWSSSATSDLLF